MSAVPKPRPRWIASSSRGTSITSAAPASGSRVIQAEDAHHCTSTRRLTTVLVFHLGSVTVTRIVYLPGWRYAWRISGAVWSSLRPSSKS